MNLCLKIKREETNKGRRSSIALAAAKAKAAAMQANAANAASSPLLPSVVPSAAARTTTVPAALAWSQLANKVLQQQQQAQQQPAIALNGTNYNNGVTNSGSDAEEAAFEEQLALIERRKQVLLAHRRRLQQEQEQQKQLQEQRERELEMEREAARNRVLLAHQRVLKEAQLCQRRDLELKKMNLQMIARHNNEILERRRNESHLIRALKLKSNLKSQPQHHHHSSNAIAAVLKAARRNNPLSSAATDALFSSSKTQQQQRWEDHMRGSENIVANALEVVSSDVVGLTTTKPAAKTATVTEFQHSFEQQNEPVVERPLVSRSPSPSSTTSSDNESVASDEGPIKRSTPPRKRWLANKRLSLLKRAADAVDETATSSSPSSSIEERPNILEQFAETAMRVGLARAA